jgi:hypothetical protein
VPLGDSFIESNEGGAYWRTVTVPAGGLVPAKERAWLVVRSVFISTMDLCVPFTKQNAYSSGTLFNAGEPGGTAAPLLLSPVKLKAAFLSIGQLYIGPISDCFTSDSVRNWGRTLLVAPPISTVLPQSFASVPFNAPFWYSVKAKYD